MLLYFEDPVSLTGCTIVPHSLVLSYASSYELLFECVTRNGEQPVDIGSLGLSWTAVIIPSFDTTATPIASASLPEGSVSGNKITVPLKTFSSAFYKYTAGRHTAPAVLSMRGYKIKDVEATCAAAFQFWIQVQGRPNQDCVPDELLILGTELQKEISDRMEADDLLQQQIDEIKETCGDVGQVAQELEQEIQDRKDADAALSQQIDAVSVSVEQLEPRVTNNEASIQGLRTDVTGLRDTVMAVDTTLGAVQSTVGQMEDTLTEHETVITNNSNGISDLSGRVQSLEAKDSTTQEAIQELQTENARQDSEISGKANIDHTHEISQVTGLQDTVSKAHTHANKTTLDKVGEQDGKLLFDGKDVSGGVPNWDDIEGKPSEFPPAAHTHEISQVTGLQDALDNTGKVKSVNGQAPDGSGNVALNIPAPVVPGQWLELTSDGKLDAKAVNTEAGLASYQKVTELNAALEALVRGRIAYAVPLVELDGVPCHYLDGTYTEMRLADFVRNVSTLKFYIRSASSSVTGNVVLTPSVNGVPRDAVVIPVTATDAPQVITFDSPATGMITITRDTGDERDTLKDADPVTAVIGTDLEVEVSK